MNHLQSDDVVAINAIKAESGKATPKADADALIAAAQKIFRSHRRLPVAFVIGLSFDG